MSTDDAGIPRTVMASSSKKGRQTDDPSDILADTFSHLFCNSAL